MDKHPHTPKRKAFKKYFKKVAGRNWVFTGEMKAGQIVTLLSIS